MNSHKQKNKKRRGVQTTRGSKGQDLEHFEGKGAVGKKNSGCEKKGQRRDKQKSFFLTIPGKKRNGTFVIGSERGRNGGKNRGKKSASTWPKPRLEGEKRKDKKKPNKNGTTIEAGCTLGGEGTGKGG